MIFYGFHGTPQLVGKTTRSLDCQVFGCFWQIRKTFQMAEIGTLGTSFAMSWIATAHIRVAGGWKRCDLKRLPPLWIPDWHSTMAAVNHPKYDAISQPTGMLRSTTCRFFESPINIFSRNPFFSPNRTPIFHPSCSSFAFSAGGTLCIPFLAHLREVQHMSQVAHVHVSNLLMCYLYVHMPSIFIGNGHSINMYQLLRNVTWWPQKPGWLGVQFLKVGTRSQSQPKHVLWFGIKEN